MSADIDAIVDELTDLRRQHYAALAEHCRDWAQTISDELEGAER